jgi:hypothetical protein
MFKNISVGLLVASTQAVKIETPDSKTPVSVTTPFSEG